MDGCADWPPPLNGVEIGCGRGWCGFRWCGCESAAIFIVIVITRRLWCGVWAVWCAKIPYICPYMPILPVYAKNADIFCYYNKNNYICNIFMCFIVILIVAK